MAWVAEGSFWVVEILVTFRVASCAAFTEVTFAFGAWGRSFYAGSFVVAPEFDEMDLRAGFAVNRFGVGLHAVIEVAQTDVAMVVHAMGGMTVVMSAAEVLVAGGITRDESVAAVAKGGGRDYAASNSLSTQQRHQLSTARPMLNPTVHVNLAGRTYVPA